jgi:hypothetical protein
MDQILRVNDSRTAKHIAMEAAKSMWGCTFPSSFYKAKYNKAEKTWDVEATYFEQRLTFKINAETGSVSSYKIEKIR